MLLGVNRLQRLPSAIAWTEKVQGHSLLRFLQWKTEHMVVQRGYIVGQTTQRDLAVGQGEVVRGLIQIVHSPIRDTAWIHPQHRIVEIVHGLAVGMSEYQARDRVGGGRREGLFNECVECAEM